MTSNFCSKLYLFGLLLLFTASKTSAQCTFDITINTKKTFCGNDGAIEVIVNNSGYFGEITYSVINSQGVEVVPEGTTNSVMTGFIPGNYTLIPSAACHANGLGSPPVKGSFPFTIETGTSPGTQVTASLNTTASKLTSFTSFNSGRIVLNINGGAGIYTIEIVQSPTAYNGPTMFLSPAAGNFIIDNLAPSSTLEYYRLRVSDGCKVFYLDNILIKPIDIEIPDLNGSLEKPIMQYVRTSGFPMHYNKDIQISPFLKVPNRGSSTVNNDGKINAYDFFNRADIGDYYEVGFGYNASAPPSTTVWLKSVANTSYQFAGDYYYSQIFANPVVGQTLPYIYIRLKNAPNTYKVYSNGYLQSGDHKGAFQSIYTESALKLVLSTLGTTPISVPYVLEAKNTNSGYTPNVISQTVPLPADLNNLTDFHVTPELALPWGSGTWQLSYRGLAGGDEQLNINIGTITIGTKDAYLNSITWNAKNYFGSICGSTFGQYYLQATNSVGSGGVSASGFYLTPHWTKITAVQVSGTTQFLPQTIEGSKSSIILTSTNGDGTGSQHLDIVPGKYEWDITIYGEGGASVTKRTSTTVYDPGEVKVEGSFNVTQSAAQCYGRRITLKKSELATLVQRKYPGKSYWENGKVRVQFYRITGTPSNPSYSNNVNVNTSNFQFTSSGPSATNFLLSDLTSNSNLASGADPVFEILESGDFAVIVTAHIDPREEINNISGYTVTSTFFPYQTSMCNIKEYFSISEEDLFAAQLDEDKSGAYRCDPGTIGNFVINLKSTAPTGVDLQYTITAVDASGRPTGAYSRTHNTNLLSYTLTDVPIGVDYLKLEVAPVGCVTSPATYTVSVYSLRTSSLLGYTGGPQCSGGITGSTLPLELWATYIPNTTYQWYYPDGTPIPASMNGDKFHATVPAISFQEGYYECHLVNNSSCSGEIYKHKIYVSADGSRDLYWAVDAINSDWNYAGNWRLTDGSVATYIPDKCINVIIPGKVDAYFPDLQSGITTGTPVCRNITFRYGAQVYHTELLDYEKAFVEYNLKYYSALPLDDTTPIQPDKNIDEGVKPEASGGVVSGLPYMSRNRWWMIASPLKDMYSGDFVLNGKPYTSMALYNKNINRPNMYVFKANPADNEYMTVVNDIDLPLTSNNNSMLLWIPAFTFAKGGEQDELQAMEGKFVFPTGKPYLEKFDVSNLSPLTQVSVGRTMANRFIYENDSNIPESSYKQTIPVDFRRTDGLLMIGNPFMAPIDLGSFYQDNSSIIENEFKILTDSGWEVLNASSANNQIAPLQGFVIKLKNPTDQAVIEFKYSILSQMSIGRNIRLR